MLERFLKGGDDQSLLSAERLMLIVAAGIVAALLLVQLSNIRARDRDNQRRADLYTLQLAVQKYYALNGQYPLSLAGISGLPASDCKDPQGSGNCQKPDYGYVVFATGTKPSVTKPSNCDDKKIACASYILFSNHMEVAANPYSVASN